MWELLSICLSLHGHSAVNTYTESVCLTIKGNARNGFKNITAVPCNACTRMCKHSLTGQDIRESVLLCIFYSFALPIGSVMQAFEMVQYLL